MRAKSKYIFAILTASLLSVSACGNEKKPVVPTKVETTTEAVVATTEPVVTSVSETENPVTSAATTTETITTPPEDKNVALYMSYDSAVDNAYIKGSDSFCSDMIGQFISYVNDKSENKIVITPKPVSQSGDTVDLCFTAASKCNTNAVKILNSPCLFLTADSAWSYIDSAGFQDMEQYAEAENDCHILGFYDNPDDMTVITSFDKTGLFSKPTDFNRFEFWVEGSKILENNRPSETMDYVMRIATDKLVAPDELYQMFKKAKKDKKYDASFYAFYGTIKEVIDAKLYEMQQNCVVLMDIYDPYVLTISNEAFNKLSASQQSVLIEAAKYVQDAQRTAYREKMAEIVSSFSDKGCSVFSSDIKSFRELAIPNCINAFIGGKISANTDAGKIFIENTRNYLNSLKG